MDQWELIFWTLVGSAVALLLVIGATRLIDAAEQRRGKTSARVLEAAFAVVAIAAAVVAGQALR